MKGFAVVEVTRIGKRLPDIEAHHNAERVPHPARAEQPLAMGARCQPRMVDVPGGAIRRCGQESPGFRFLQFDSVSMSGAVREQDAASPDR